MPKIGRNEPCPCKSGKKYKKCCLPVHEAADRERIRVLREPPADSYAQVVAEMEELNDLSNRANAAIHARRFDEAERLCNELRDRYPDQIDALDRRAQLFEARGDTQAALLWRRKVLLFAQSKEGFDDEALEGMREDIAALEAAPPRAHDEP